MQDSKCKKFGISYIYLTLAKDIFGLVVQIQELKCMVSIIFTLSACHYRSSVDCGGVACVCTGHMHLNPFVSTKAS